VRLSKLPFWRLAIVPNLEPPRRIKRRLRSSPSQLENVKEEIVTPIKEDSIEQEIEFPPPAMMS